ncbi:hypothetical protein KIH41_13235 [Litoribacter ruber]|uniref:Uncharacterized protein n=1 Tax=Litoribacter ruber TaxID=702568 RepID=A0AAP2G0Z2_9BACT|nr:MULTISPECIES: hypothetical protein [Litoribacter]MBS9523729.1 hypothetical protein [Litoribacter alkaliphilus]MBT0812243.1 hypothetical protein [Litoribacter ruber]
MAKIKHKLGAISGTIDNKTYVNSDTYGEHVRAARGTHKEAVLNDVMQAWTKAPAVKNKMAGLLNTVVKNNSGILFSTKNYQPMLAKLDQHYKLHGEYAWKALVGMDLVNKNPFDRFGLSFGREWVNRRGNVLKFDWSAIQDWSLESSGLIGFDLHLYFLGYIPEIENFEIASLQLSANGKQLEPVSTQRLKFSKDVKDIIIVAKFLGYSDRFHLEMVGNSGMKVLQVI